MCATLTDFEYSLSAAPVDFLSADRKAGGVGEVYVAGFCVEVQGPWADQILDLHHVLIAGLNIHVQASDDTGPAFPVEQEQLVLGFCRRDY